MAAPLGLSPARVNPKGGSPVVERMPANADLPKEAILIVNAMSRRGADAFEQVREKISEAGVRLIESHAVHEPEEMEPTVKSAIEKAPMVIVGGGDGSLSSNVDFFVGKDTVFAILPLGTANSFAKTLGIGDNLDSAVDAIANGQRRRIDLGMIDGDYFANAAALGLSPLIADTVPHKLKRYLGMFGYMLWAIRVAFKFRPFRLIVTEENGKRHRVWATEARIANGTHHGGVELVESQELDSGDIVIQAVTGRSLLRLAWSWFATLLKLSAKKQTVTEWRGRKLQLDAHPTQKISVDGELVAKTPVTIEVADACIEVAAPRDSNPQG